MAELKKNGLVRVHSVSTVVSSKPIGPGKVHKLTALDHALGLHTVRIIFYYQANPFKDGPMEHDLDNLWISLSELLFDYPPVTGRLTRGGGGNWEIKCNDAGVRMLRANVGATLDEWLRLADANAEGDLTVSEDMPDDPHIWSPFRIQINDFQCGGLAIGISYPHMLADLTCTTQLVKSWTEVHRGVPVTNPPVFNLSPRGQSSSNQKVAEFYATKSEAQTTSLEMATATFKFSDSMIKQCLSQVHEKCPHATAFDVLVALLWSRIAQFKPATHDHKYFLSLCLDLRKPAQKPIPYGYFGNALHFTELSINAEELDNGGLGLVAGLVHNHLASIEEDELWSTIDWFESCKEENGQHPPPFRMYGPELTCVSMEHMIGPDGSPDQSLMYEAMFKKDEQPIHVSYHIQNVQGEGLIMVMPSPEGALARTVMVTLPEEQIIKFNEDEVIMQFEPVVLLGGKVVTTAFHGFNSETMQ